MFGVLPLERDPLRLSDLPGMVSSWVQVAGGVAAVCLLLWLLNYLFQTLFQSRPNRGVRPGPVESALFLTALGGAALCYVLAGVVTLVARSHAAEVAKDPSGPAAASLATFTSLQAAFLTAGGICALIAVCLPILINLLSVRPRRVWALARLSFKEAIRRRALYGFCFILLVFLFASWFIPYKPEDQVRTYVQVVYWVMTLLLLLTAVLLAAFSIPADIRSQTIHTVVTKPVERFEIVLGRFLGYLGLMTLVLLAMTGVSLLYVLRGINPEAAAESLKAREPAYGDLSFENSPNQKTKGEDVGREWGYRKYISAPMPGQPPIIAVWDFPTVPAGLADRQQVRCEFGFDVYRTTKGQEKKGVSCAFTFRTAAYAQGNDEKYRQESAARRREANRATNLDIDNELSEKFGYYEVAGKEVTDYHTQSLDLPGGLFKSALKGGGSSPGGAAGARPALEVRVRCNSPTQYVGMAKYDLYLREDNPSGGAEKALFAMNFFKGSFGLWLRLALIIGLAVAMSTYLSGVIAFLVAGMLFLGGYFLDFIQSVAQGKNLGGGPLEATLRLAGRNPGTAPLETTTPVKVAQQFDEAFRWIIGGVLKIIPDVERFDLTNYVSEGFNINGVQMFLHFLLLAGYILPWAVLAYYLMRWREVASSS
jgi:hypothetical protein